MCLLSSLFSGNVLANYNKWRSFHGNGRELAKVPFLAVGGRAHFYHSHNTSDFLTPIISGYN